MKISKGDYARVYYNLHKHCLSVQNKNRIVVGHTDKAIIQDAEFFVSEPGRKRVVKEERKNVHAKVRGIWRPDIDADHLDTRVRYNPYLFEHFVIAETEEPIYHADVVLIDGQEMFI